MNEWILSRRWHAIRTWTRVPQRAITRCGWTITSSTTAPKPTSARPTCKRCVKVVEP